MALEGDKLAVFLDKDGTLLRNVPYNVDVSRMRFSEGAQEALPLLARAGLSLVVVTNQSGVARGLFPERDLEPVRERLEAMVADLGCRLDGFYYCPHLPQAVHPRYARHCTCRKPRSGMLRQAARDLGIDLRLSWMIGDTLDDVEAGSRAGCRSIFLDNGGETMWRRGPERWPYATVQDLEQAAWLIVKSLAGRRVEESCLR